MLQAHKYKNCHLYTHAVYHADEKTYILHFTITAKRTVVKKGKTSLSHKIK
jgi:hypothetical protein